MTDVPQTNLIITPTTALVGLTGAKLLSGSSAIIVCEPLGTLAPVFSVDSTSTVTIGNTGTKTFTIVGNASYLKGTRVRATATGGAWIEGTVSSYSGTTLTMVADRAFGSGTFSDWHLDLTGRAYPWPIYGNTVLDGTLVESRSSNIATFALKTLAGDDPTPTNPVAILLPTGELLKVQSRLSLSINSGATLGLTVNSSAFRLWFLLVYQAGFNVHLVVVQTRNSSNEIISFPHSYLTTTLMSTDADSAGVFYSDLAMTSVPFVVLGYAEYDAGLQTVGYWSVAPTRIMLYAAGAPLPGDVVQQAGYSTGTHGQSSTETYTVGDSIPQITDGIQFMSYAITPLHQANLLDVSARGNWQTNFNAYAVSALFKVGQSNALDAKVLGPNNVSYPLYHETDLHVRILANGVSAQTFSLRGGSSGAIAFNGNIGTQFFNGTFNSFISILELMT